VTAFDERKIEMPRKRQGRASLAKTSPAIFIRSLLYNESCNMYYDNQDDEEGEGDGDRHGRKSGMHKKEICSTSTRGISSHKLCSQ